MDETPLSLALIHGDMDIVKALVEANSNVNHIGFLPGNSSEQKESLLSRFLDKKGSCASLEQRTLLVNFLIKNGASVNLDKKGVDSPLIKAVKLAFFSFSQKKAQDVGLSLSALDLVAELLKLGSNINHGGKNLMTALHVYCKQKGGSIFTSEEEDDDEDEGDSETGNVDEANNPLYKIFKLLLNSGASVNVQAKSGATPVHIGLRRRCIPEVLDMLNENFEANTKDASGVTCLMLAWKYGEEQIIKALLKCGADVNLEDESSNTALHYLCKTGQNMEILDTLVQGGSHINAVNKDGYSPLNIYVKEAQRLEKEIVIDLLSKGADPNCCPGGCESPLTNALNRVEYETAKVLLKAGALVNYISRSGISPLSMAVSKTKERRRFFAITEEKAKKTKQREEMVNCLLEAGADTNIQTENKTSLVCSLLSSPFRQDTLGILSDLLEHNGNPNIGTENPLCLAARLNIDIVKLLLKFGTNVNRKGSKENTPLVEYLLSLQTGKRDDQMEILKSLVEAGADTNIASNTGKCPLEIVLEDYLVLLDEGFVNKVRRASLWHSYYSEENAKLHLQKLLSLLIDAGANCSQRKMGADSVLHIAVAIGEKNIVEMLIKNGSDVNHIGENKDMPLHRYLKRDTTMNGTRETVLDVLLSYNANPNAKDGDGNTPLCLSLRTNAEDFRKLLAAGADPFSKEENVLQKCVMSDDLSFLNVLLQEKGTLFICNSLFSKFWERQNGVTFLRNRSLIATVTLQMLSSPQELNVNIKNRLGATPLLFFCEQNKDLVVKRLLERGADVNTVHNDGRTALHIIICSRDRDARYTILTLLMKKNPELKIMDSSGKTAFQRAEEEYQDNIYYKRIDYKWLSIFMKEALLAGQICEKSHLNSLLVLASQKKHFDLMTILVEKGADLTVKKDQKGVLHLCWSLQYHYEERANVSSEECLNFLRIYKKHGGKMDDLDRDGNTPLVLFLKHGLYDFDAAPDKLVDLRDEIVSLLACDGSTVRKRDNTGSSAIHIVSSEGWLSTMKILVQKGANISEKDDKQNTCLHLCSMGAPGEFLYDIIVYLVERKAVINELNIRGESPLFILVDKRGTLSELKCIDVIEYLLKKGALPNLHLKLCNPLVAAIRSASVKLIHLLLDYHAKVNEIEDGPTALHIFFRCFRSFNKINQDDIENVAHRILKKGANVNDRDDTGKTALHLAIKALCSVDRKCNTESIIQQLLDYGADINAVDKNGHTPLSIVCETRGSTDRAHLGCCLLSKGADPNIDFALNQCMRNIDYYGLNADWKIFILSLIQNGADPNQYRDGKPPIHFAIKSGHSDIVKFLIEKGVNIQSCDKDENTCLHLACDLKTESERYEIASLLLEHGCSVNKSNKCGTTPLSNVIKRMIEDTNSMKIEHSETATVAKVDLSLFNWLICGGAKIDPVVKTSTSYSYYGKSILSILLRNGFFGAAATLLKCGYNWKDDGDFKNVDFSNQENSTILINGKRYNRISYEQEKNLFLNVLKKQEEKEETSLSSLCRYAIRMNLTEAGQGAEIESKIMLLPVPGRIKTYLSLREHTQDFEQMQLESKESTPAGISIQTLMDAYYPRGIVIDEYYGRDDSDVDEYMYYHGNDSDSDDYYY
ncbi:uncharacterized protein LOC134248743 isoform X2 [Saccostrea cucullata]|uniref:uncharacterized protein LOC134248743 isoform X2 n=1 Tax=Saccostrea cuccullata TaxID=36930 RepID=UPI002ED21554